MADKTAIIAGLGNPGKQYSMNRHNVGFMVLELLAQEFNTSLSTSKWEGEYAKVRARDKDDNPMDLVLLRPLTFMNLSGKTVCPAARFFKVPAERLLVIHDEIETAFADLRFKKGGGHKGHNGLRDIIAKCGGADFHRLRVGVDRPEHPDVASHVLGNFSKDEQARLPELLERGRDHCLDWVKTV